MVKEKKYTAKILSIQDTSEIGFISLPEKLYRSFIKSIETINDVYFRKIKQIILTDDVLSTTNQIIQPLSYRRKNINLLLILEVLNQNFSLRKYDNLCSCLVNALSGKNISKPWCLIIVVPDSQLFSQSIILKRLLVTLCTEKEISLILLSNKRRAEPLILVQGKVPSGWQPPLLDNFYDSEVPETEEKTHLCSKQQILENFISLFGHFELKIGDEIFHVPSVCSVKKLARNSDFIDFLYDEAIKLVDNENFIVQPIGIPLGGINELAASLIQKNDKQICHIEDVETYTNCSVIILCDYLSNIYSLDKVARKLGKMGARNISVLGIGRYKDFNDIENVNIKCFFDTEYVSTGRGNESCAFCNQNTPRIKGENFKDFELSVEKFDSFTFWEFIKQSNQYFKVGHWASDRTANHYHFRIITNPIFKYHCHDLSVRVRNILISKNLIPQWIKKIVCTGGEESNILSLGLAEAFKLSPKDVIQIPRKYFKFITGKNVDTKLIEYIDQTAGEHSLKDKNVLIVDQAAHHLKTFSALRTVCEFYNCSIIGFVVFVDRTEPEISLGEYLYLSHYVPLYSWPSPPRLEHQCPCMQIGKNERLD